MFTNQPITDLLAEDRLLSSVEFFPPKDASGEEMFHNAVTDLLSAYRPDFVSITYGAGGSTRDRTLRYARMLKDRYHLQVMPHFTCVGSSLSELEATLVKYSEAGFRNVMTLRGDPPSGQSHFVPAPDGLSYAGELVEFIREHFPDLCMGVAGYPEKHPEAPSLKEDIRRLREKVEAGAAFITTQLFYENESFFRFVDCCRQEGITVPIFAGLMPVVSLEQSRRFCAMCEANLPKALIKSLEAAPDAEAVQQVGIDWTCEQIEGLKTHDIAGIHLYILNRSGSAKRLIQKI